jgi:hypothetical protein
VNKEYTKQVVYNKIINLIDENYRDGNDPKDAIMCYVGLFYKRRRDYFDRYYRGKKNYLSTNLNFTT